MTEAEPPSAPKRRRRTVSQVMQLAKVRHDLESHAKTLTVLMEREQRFSPEQLDQIKAAFRAELADAGLRLDNEDHQDDARRDFMFLRALRRGVNGTAAKIGWLIIAAVFGGVIWLVTNGLNAWRGS